MTTPTSRTDELVKLARLRSDTLSQQLADALEAAMQRIASQINTLDDVSARLAGQYEIATELRADRDTCVELNHGLKEQARADEAAMREIATLLKGTSLQTRCPVSVMDAYTILLERLAAREEKEKPQ